MSLFFLADLAPPVWLSLAGPVVALASVACAVLFRGRPFVELGRGLGELVRVPASDDGPGPAGEPEPPRGRMPPGLAAGLASVGGFGAAGLVGAGTAISLGGAGALPWIWVIALVLVPLRYAEAMLARTPPPGQRGVPGALATRLRRDAHLGLRGLGWALAIGLALAGVVVVGGLHGHAAAEAVDELAPETMPALLGACALGAGLLAAWPGRRAAALVVGGLVLAGLAAWLGVALATLVAEPARTLGALGRALGEMSAGAPSVDAFVGATAGEIAVGALLAWVPPAAAGAGIVGAAHAEADASSTRRQAALAGATPLLAAALVTLIGMGLVGTGAFYRPTPDQRPLRQLTAWSEPFETPTQRAEESRRLDGYMRIEAGFARDLDVELATPRGVIEGRARWLDRGGLADVALQVEDGRPTAVLERAPGTRALERVPLSRVDDLEIEAEMLPQGAGLLLASAAEGAGAPGVRLAVLGLLLWTLAAAVVWGHAIRRSLTGAVPAALGAVLAVLPAVGLLLVAFGLGEILAVAAAPLGAFVACLGAAGLALRARQAARA